MTVFTVIVKLHKTVTTLQHEICSNRNLHSPAMFTPIYLQNKLSLFLFTVQVLQPDSKLNPEV